MAAVSWNKKTVSGTTYTVLQADLGIVLEFTHSGNVTVTVPDTLVGTFRFMRGSGGDIDQNIRTSSGNVVYTSSGNPVT